jgi:hypothetical protein
MTKYKVISNRRNFSLTEGDKILGELLFLKWFSLNAVIKINEKSDHKFETKGFWKRTIELFQNDIKLLELKMGWKGIEIETHFDNHLTTYRLKNKSIFSNNFTLIDSYEKELVQIDSKFQWKKQRYDYEITTSSEFDKITNDKILVFAIIYSINYRNASMAAAGAVA